MSNATFDEVVRLVDQLTRSEQEALIAHLQSKSKTYEERGAEMRAEIMAEIERRKAAGAFKNVQSLRNKYANPALDNLTDEQLRADLHEIATEWEKELDEFYGDED